MAFNDFFSLGRMNKNFSYTFIIIQLLTILVHFEAVPYCEVCHTILTD